MKRGIPPRKHDVVVLHQARRVPAHEHAVHEDIGRRIADMMDVPYDGVHDPDRHAGLICYYIPATTVIGTEAKMALGLRGEFDLFGGYAEHAFVPTKAITHGLVGPDAARPIGWSEAFAESVSNVVLPGYTAFSAEDIRLAAKRLLASGPLRTKPVEATAGRGQTVIRTAAELESALAAVDFTHLAQCGIVLEAQLEDVSTYSVGQVRLHGLTISYVGTQCLTRDNDGEEVYGGSHLHFGRGDFEALSRLPLPADFQAAIGLAQQYDRAADACFPDFFASRRNYDVAAGTDADGRRVMGVLEQSWRIGGASRAEIAALEVMAADPSCQQLGARTLELFGTEAAAPADAIEVFSGVDPDIGLIRKYVMVQAYGDT